MNDPRLGRDTGDRVIDVFVVASFPFLVDIWKEYLYRFDPDWLSQGLGMAGRGWMCFLGSVDAFLLAWACVAASRGRYRMFGIVPGPMARLVYAVLGLGAALTAAYAFLAAPWIGAGG